MSSNLSAGNSSIIIVVSDFNEKVIENLLQGALDAFAHHGGNKSNILVFRVPGAFEIPGAIVQVQKHHSPDAIVALGAVIRERHPILILLQVNLLVVLQKLVEIQIFPL